jgi:outer membrane lipoprotein carrier protein
MKQYAALVLSLSLLFIPGGLTANDETEKTLDLVREAYASLTGLTARFVQTDERPGIGVNSHEKGTLFFQPPDRMRWDYGGKRPHSVIINVSRIWIHTPSRNQVIVTEMTPEEMRKGATTFLGGLAGIEDDFTVQSRLTKEGEEIPLDLFPLDEAVPYDKISVLVSPVSGLINRISIHHRLGNVTTITFYGIKTAVKLDDKLFEWNIPEGTEVIEP